MHADYLQLDWLYEDYVLGIRQACADPQVVQRIAPLRFLEYSLTQPKVAGVTPWRNGAKMRKMVMERKTVIYAILERLPDPSGLP